MRPTELSCRNLLLYVSFLLSLGAAHLSAEPVTRLYRYTLGWDAPNTHTYTISLSTEASEGFSTVFELPRWRPGRYIIQDYAAAVSHFEAMDRKGKPLDWRKTGVSTWAVDNPAEGRITIRYRYYARYLDAGSSYRGQQLAYFNPINLFMHVQGDYQSPCELHVPDLPSSWRQATALPPVDQTHNRFATQSYHQLAECPTIFAKALTQFEFEYDGIPIYLHFYGKFEADRDAAREKLVDAVTRIIQAQEKVFGSVPCPYYHFIYYLNPYGIRHAVEHTNSSMYTLPQTVAESVEALDGLLGITSHEFWHVWNVKRVRPAALWPYQYSEPAYTQLHWFTEGVTDYYTHLMLLRAGLMSEEAYFDKLANLFARLDNSPAAEVVSPASSSFNSWLAASNYNSPHHRASYYSLGSRVGLLLDWEMRRRSAGKVSLDHLFQHLYTTYYQNDQGVPEDGIQRAAEVLTGESFQDFFDNYVTGVERYNYARLFRDFDLAFDTETQGDDREKVGILEAEWQESEGLLVIKQVHPNSDAFAAGLDRNDIVLQVDNKNISRLGWEEQLGGWKRNETRTLTISRMGETLNLQIQYTGNYEPQAYSISGYGEDNENDLFRAWLEGRMD